MVSTRNYSDVKDMVNHQNNKYNTAPGANTNIFTSDLRAKRRPCYFRIQVALSAPAKFFAVLNDGSTDTTHIFNNNQALDTNTVYEFTLEFDGSSTTKTANFQVDAAVTINSLTIDEVDEAM